MAPSLRDGFMGHSFPHRDLAYISGRNDGTTERVFNNTRNVRLAGIGLLLMALPCLMWPQPYFVVTGIILVLSGLLRAVTPGYNIRLEKGVLPRWGHGLGITGVAAVEWLIYRYSV